MTSHYPSTTQNVCVIYSAWVTHNGKGVQFKAFKHFITFSMMMGNLEEGIPVISIGEWMLEHLRKYAGSENIAQIFADDGSSMTYGKLLRDSIYVAEGLKAMGFKSGETVSFVTRNCHEVIPLAIGFLMTDVLVAPSIAERNSNELYHNFIQISPNHILTTKAKIPEVQKAIKNLKTKPIVYDLLDLFTEAKEKGSKTDLDKFEAVKIADPKTHSVLCFFSSGTTGRPKAVVTNDYGFMRGVYLACPYTKKFEGAIILGYQPYGTTWWLSLLKAVRFGRTRVLLDKNSLEIMVEAIHKHKPEVLLTLPNPLGAMHRVIQESRGKWSISSLKIIFVSGDACDATMHEENMKKLGVPIYQGYGTTEITVALTSSLEDPVVYRSIGKPCCPVKVVDVNTGKVITEPKKTGELRVQWVSMTCYLNNPEATREAFDEEGWYKTGDIVYFNENGHYFMVDRLEDMFRYCGFTIAPSELAEFVRRIPGVAEVVVVGKPDYSVGHVPTAFIVKAPDSNLTAKDIHDFFEKEKVHETRRFNGGIIFVNEIPTNSNGKLMRSSLLDMLPK